MHFFIGATRSVHAPLALVGTPLRRVARHRRLASDKRDGVGATLQGMGTLLHLAAGLVGFRHTSACSKDLCMSRCRLDACVRRAVSTFHSCTGVGRVGLACRDDFHCLGM